MNQWNITGPKFFIDQMSKSKYFKRSMGQSLTMDRNGNREMREGSFTSWYYTNYKSLIFKVGEIGSLHFYIDYYLKKDILGFFIGGSEDKHQYAIEWDQEYIDRNGIDSWISEKLKELDETIDELNRRRIQKEEDSKIVGDKEKLKLNPGSVSWKDIEDYYKKKKNI